MRRLLFFLCCIGQTVGGSVAVSQGQRAHLLLHQADSVAALRNYPEAERLFKTLLVDSSSSFDAIFGLGRLYFEQHRWSESIDRFDAILKRNPNDLSAHYHCAVAYRELGAEAALLMRAIRWGKAEDHFHAVIERDSSFEDLLYQQSILESYREHTLTAISLVREQLRRKPSLLNAQLGLLRFYGDYIRETRPEEAIAWLEAQQTESAMFATGELYRRKKRDIQAEIVFNELVDRVTELPPQAPLLSLVRLYALQKEQYKTEQTYWRAVNSPASRLGIALLFEDIKYVLSDAELTQFESLRTPAERVNFFKSFWAKRNPTPASSLNNRLYEHYRRLVEAENSYEYRRLRTEFSNPDQFHELQFPLAYKLNHEFSDKGIIYLRFGEPDFSYTPSGPFPSQEGMESVISSNTMMENEPNEVWLYEATRFNPRMIFHFILQHSGGGNWRLAPVPTDPRVFEFLSGWDHKYGRFLSRGEAGRAAVRDEIAGENRQTVAAALTSERMSEKKEFTRFIPPLSVNTFRGERGGTSLDISFALPISVAAQKLSSDPVSLSWIASATVKDLAGRVVHTELDSFKVSANEDSRGMVLDLFRSTVPPDSYSVSLYLENQQLKLIGEQTVKIEARDYGKAEFQLSDIQFLLESPIKPKMEIEGIKVVPSPLRRLTLEKPFRLYHHLYHLQKNGAGKTAWGIEYIITPLQLTDRSQQQLPVSYSFEKNGSDEFADQYFAFNAVNAKPGIYRLTVRATDRVSESTTERTALIELY